MTKVIAIIGTYRKGKNIDTAVSKILEGAQSCGAETEKIYLTDVPIEFCTNCFACTTGDPSEPRAKCVIDDGMEEILDKIDAADGIVLASPVNFGTVTAIMKRFIERLSVYVSWQLDGKVRPPKKRVKTPTEKSDPRHHQHDARGYGPDTHTKRDDDNESRRRTDRGESYRQTLVRHDTGKHEIRTQRKRFE